MKRYLSIKTLAVILIIGAASMLRLHNAAFYPYILGMDCSGHIDYINDLAAGRFPLLLGYADKHEYVHPPAYYFISAQLVKLWSALDKVDLYKVVQYYSWALSTAAIALFAMLAARFLQGPSTLKLSALLFLAFLPGEIVLDPMIGYRIQMFFLSSLILYYYFHCTVSKQPTLREVLVMGLILALGNLSQYTGTVFSLVVLLSFLFSAVRGREGRAGNRALFAVLLVTVLLASGWFYALNQRIYGSFFIWNMPGEQYQPKKGMEILSNRSPSYFVLFDAEMFRSTDFGGASRYFWSGLYAGMWLDERNFFFPKLYHRNQLTEPMRHETDHLRLQRILACLGIAPTLVLLLGAVAAASDLLRRRSTPVYSLAFFISFSFIISMALFVIKYPFDDLGVLKFSYMVGAAPALGILFFRGAKALVSRFSFMAYPILAYQVLLSLFILDLFWL